MEARHIKLYMLFSNRSVLPSDCAKLVEGRCSSAVVQEPVQEPAQQCSSAVASAAAQQCSSAVAQQRSSAAVH